jgi:hypothetical protein
MRFHAPLPGTGRTAPDGMPGCYLPLRSLAAARLWAAGHAPARGSWSTRVRSSPLAAIVLACPNGVNPAARPDPAGCHDKQEGAAGLMFR